VPVDVNRIAAGDIMSNISSRSDSLIIHLSPRLPNIYHYRMMRTESRKINTHGPVGDHVFAFVARAGGTVWDAEPKFVDIVVAVDCLEGRSIRCAERSRRS
jgi:hypothetical protein